VPESTAAGVVTAIAACITALALLVGALPLLVKAINESRKVRVTVDEVHTIVNQQRTDAANYNRALTAALNAAGVEVPVDQSLPADPVA
jgi:hypothetical protein